MVSYVQEIKRGQGGCSVDSGIAGITRRHVHSNLSLFIRKDRPMAVVSNQQHLSQLAHHPY